MVLPKYFLLTARKILILPKSSKLGGAIAPPAPPAGTAMNTIKESFARALCPKPTFNSCLSSSPLHISVCVSSLASRLYIDKRSRDSKRWNRLERFGHACALKLERIFPGK